MRKLVTASVLRRKKYDILYIKHEFVLLDWQYKTKALLWAIIKSMISTLIIKTVLKHTYTYTQAQNPNITNSRRKMNSLPWNAFATWARQSLVHLSYILHMRRAIWQAMESMRGTQKPVESINISRLLQNTSKHKHICIWTHFPV